MAAVLAELQRGTTQRVHLRAVTVAQYHRLIRDSYYTKDDHVELIQGMVIEKIPRDPIHDNIIYKLYLRIIKRLPDGMIARNQSAITLEDSEPEPDIVVAIGDEDTFAEAHPGPADILLIIEVANSSMAFDSSLKFETYAASGIKSYAILNFAEKQLHLYTQPAEGAYQSTQTFSRTDVVTIPLGDKTLTLELASVFA